MPENQMWPPYEGSDEDDEVTAGQSSKFTGAGTNDDSDVNGSGFKKCCPKLFKIKKSIFRYCPSCWHKLSGCSICLLVTFVLVALFMIIGLRQKFIDIVY